jgi:IS6 family transposase
VDSKGATIDFLLAANRDIRAAKRFFRKALSSTHAQSPCVITIDKNPAYPPVLEQLMIETVLSKMTLIRQTKYLNNIIEQDHRFIKKITNPMMRFKSFHTAEQTIKGIEALHMLRKRQVEISPVFSSVVWMNKLFGLAA